MIMREERPELREKAAPSWTEEIFSNCQFCIFFLSSKKKRITTVTTKRIKNIFSQGDKQTQVLFFLIEMRILLQAFLSFENGSFKSLWLKFQKAVSLPKILENPQTLCINMKCVIYIETGLCLIFVEIYRLGDIRLGLNSIVEFNSVFF